MPSYKHKWYQVLHRLDKMESRTLITESALRSLIDQVNRSQNGVPATHEADEEGMRSIAQLMIQLTELAELIGVELEPPNIMSRTTYQGILDVACRSISAVTRALRESEVRAETLLKSIEEPKTGKLLKRSRREQMRKESISSLVAVLSQPRSAGASSRSRANTTDHSEQDVLSDRT